MNLSKAFVTVNHDLLSKLRAYYGFNKILFHSLEAILQTGTGTREFAAFSVTGTESLLGFLGV